MNSRSTVLRACVAMLAVIMFLIPLSTMAASSPVSKADKKCVTCHRRVGFKDDPPPGEERQVHITANEFIQASHEQLSCRNCHQDILKTPHRKKIERTVDCVSCHRRHPEFILRDKDGVPVIESGQPLSTMASCAQCHDTEFIEASSDHADAGASHMYTDERPEPWEAGPGYYGGWDPIRYDADVLDEQGGVDLDSWLKHYGYRHIGGGPAEQQVEMNCLMCHSNIDDHSARATALREGDFAWANSVPLKETGALDFADDQWQWNTEAFQSDGRLRIGLIDIVNPDTNKCGQCHGQVSNDLAVPLEFETDPRERNLTERTGQIVAPHLLSESGLPIVTQDGEDHPLDVHLDKGLECVSCHYSLKNPVYYRDQEVEKPIHMVFDPRRPNMKDYLDQPSHQFAKGRSIHGLAAEDSAGSLRRCEACHDASEVHEWLPFKSKHFESLACETCHIRKIYGPALQAIDWTILDQDGEPLRQYRGVDGDPASEAFEIVGFRPVVLPRLRETGKYKLAPFNAVTSWFWLAGDPPRPISHENLQAALLTTDGYHPDLIEGLDRNGDGQLENDELHLETAERQDIVRRRLEAAGFWPATVETEITPFPLNHNVVSGKWATWNCRDCHGADSILQAQFPMSTYLPGGQAPSSAGYASVEYSGQLVLTESGGVEGLPDLSQAGFYIIGLDAVEWIDWMGLMLFFAVLGGISIHGFGRYMSSRKLGEPERNLKRVYMYDVYERIWHWLQAIMIIYLLFTGIVIHKPHLFEGFNFAWMVSSHNVFGFVLLANALLALFYSVVSGRFQEYLPEPKDFFANSIKQAMFYMSGIFRGHHHPFEKTRRKKLNPLQQVTYLAILNVLLPAQVITGIMIYWGQQNWPILFSSLGGLPVLAPIHTAVAWLFASFILMHVYLVTASGHTPLAATKSMITGWEDVERRPRGSKSK